MPEKKNLRFTWMRCVAVPALIAATNIGCNRQDAPVAANESDANASRIVQDDQSNALHDDPAADPALRQLVSSEELILELTPHLKRLGKSLMNLQFPDAAAQDLFAHRTEVFELGEPEAPKGDDATLFTQRDVPISPQSHDAAPADANWWRTLIAEVAWFDHVKFYFIEATFTDDDFKTLRAKMGVAGHAKLANGGEAALEGKLNVIWRNVPSAEPPWQIVRWQPVEIHLMDSPALLFRNVLANAVDDKAVLHRAQTSKHEEITALLLQNKPVPRPVNDTYPFFFPDVVLEHPGLAVVDINSDGFDDLFVAMQHDNNLLFRNRGDGTFAEVAVEYGLDFGPATSAVFVDFDNDGDRDLFLGRARHRAMYLANESGRFVDRSDTLDFPMPYMVSSIAVADYNNDGLLDVYLSTYSPIEEMNRLDTLKDPVWVRHFLTPDQREEFNRHMETGHPFLNYPGPPNLLLRNAGEGKFVIAPEAPQLELYKKTFQSTWSDFDDDGDPDLYVANDFAPDVLLRNDGAAGFVDASAELGLDMMAFGMGVGWGDYDNNGTFDLYVTNMYSKAGRRITAQLAEVDKRFKHAAAGNFLYRNSDKKFDMVSGIEKSDIPVMKVGWAWGGQFVDLDNDAFQDIFVPSGFYSAPQQVALDVDL